MVVTKLAPSPSKFQRPSANSRDPRRTIADQNINRVIFLPESNPYFQVSPVLVSSLVSIWSKRITLPGEQRNKLLFIAQYDNTILLSLSIS